MSDNKKRVTIMNDLNMQYKNLEKAGDSMTDVSWGWQQGIIISGNDAKEIVEMYLELVKYRRGFFGSKNRK
jgi:hypothetical protein